MAEEETPHIKVPFPVGEAVVAELRAWLPPACGISPECVNATSVYGWKVPREERDLETIEVGGFGVWDYLDATEPPTKAGCIEELRKQVRPLTTLLLDPA